MKKLLALAVLATSTIAYSASDIYDIMYLPSAGISYGFSQAEWVMNKAEIGGEDLETDGYRLVQTIGHSVSDKFSLQASLNYVDLESDFDGDSTQTDGISDPVVDTRYRFMDDSLRWDLLGSVVLGGAGDAKTDADGDSNNYSGGLSAVVGTQIGQKLASFQWAGLVQVKHNFESAEKENGVAIKNDAFNELLLKGDILNKLAESSFLRTFASVNFAQDYETDVSTTIASATTMAVGTEYQHLCSKDFLARAGVDYAISNQDTGSIEDNQGWTIRLGANYQF